MNQNINYIGMVNLLRHLQTAGLVSRKEAGRIAARLRTETGADVIFSRFGTGRTSPGNDR